MALAWVVLLAGPSGHAAGDRPETAGPALVCDVREYQRQATATAPSAGGVESASSGLLAALPDWTLMAVAMMAPVALPAVRHVGLNSIRRRRQRAMALYFAVFVGVWVAFGGLALAAERVLRETLAVEGDVPLALALAVAAAWQLTRTKRRALLACMRTVPLPPMGLRADAGCARFALQQGWRCVKSCWALMLVVVVVGHSGLVWMAALTLLIVLEELTLLGRRLLRPSAAALALAAGLLALGG